MNTLVYHTGALGDFLTILPALDLWRHYNPRHRISLLGRPEFGILAQKKGYLETIYDCRRAEYVPLFTGTLPETLRHWLAQFDSAIVFTADDSPLLETLRGTIPTIYNQQPFPADRIPIIRYHLSLFETVFPLPCDTSLSLTPDVKKDSPRMPRPLCALHPGSGSERKNWPFERFIALSRMIKNDNIGIVWIAGPAEYGFDFPPEDSIVRTDTLCTVAERLHRCTCYIGNDSGISHLAAALGCKSTVLFGPSDPVVWKPAGQSVSVIAMHRDCCPCHPSDPLKPFCGRSCMEDIGIERVYGAYRKFLTKITVK
jgi:ADP-heptose:LPS heptosyltransferase